MRRFLGILMYACALEALLFLVACGDDADGSSSGTGSGTLCQSEDAPEACGTPCSEDVSICGEGLYCDSSGFCSADCNGTTVECSEGQVCSTSNGRCSTPGSGPDAISCDTIEATIRDFRAYYEEGGHPDFGLVENPDNLPAFNYMNMEQLGMVKDELGDDLKPVYNYDQLTAVDKPQGEQQSGSKADFDQWYRDVEGVNRTFSIQLPLDSTGAFEDPDGEFFPLDDVAESFGLTGPLPDDAVNAGISYDPHNFHFTTEIHTRFTYEASEKQVFKFIGDDDVWVFVNGKLALDLGGVHGALEKEIDFEAKADELGLVDGEEYSMDLFHAERHVTESNFRFETNITCFSNVVLE